jgi:3-hydroxyisobutyrate dehydrogenase-like beta-hydroxyacid dehydrogenase
MGAPIVRRLLAAGYSVIVHDVKPQAMEPLVALGARPAASPKAAADLATTVFVCLPDLGAVQSVALGSDGIAYGKQAKIYVDLSTTGSKVAKHVAAGLAARGIDALDAPVTGGIAGAKEGRLTIMVSGPRVAFDAVMPIFAPISGQVVFVGESPGQAQTMKLINNMLSAAALAVTSETFVLGAKAGLDMDMLLEVVNRSSGRNSATDDKFPRSVLPRKFDQFGRTDIIYKDVCLCLEEAEELGVPMWVCSAVRQLFTYAVTQGAAKQEMTTLVKYVEQWAGTEVKGREAYRES